jgi:cytochrome c oxidase assembly protein subunit 11
LSQKNNKTAFKVSGIVFAMFVLAFLSFPIYNLFCKVTGYGGKPVRAEAMAEEMGTKNIQVFFNADISKDLQWSFAPAERSVDVTTGENKLIFYTAQNKTDKDLKGVATFNVTPAKAAIYFSKVECFCFVEQTLLPNERVEMPVSFYIDPEFDNDPNMKDVKAMTLSYTFFKSES